MDITSDHSSKTFLKMVDAMYISILYSVRNINHQRLFGYQFYHHVVICILNYLHIMVIDLIP